jgi:DNA repair exonuclease SbcCD ATPase subunit
MKSSYRDRLDKQAAVHEYNKSQLKRHKSELSVLKRESDDHKKIRDTYKQAAVTTQSYLEKHLSLIVTNALQSVFYEEDFEFVVKFSEKRNATECSLTIIDDGEEYDIIEDKGFGVADIASFALRVAYVLLDSTDNVIIFDEPFRNLDKNRIPLASKMVKELSHKLDMQFIIISHIKELAECADKSVQIAKVKKFSEVVYESV